MPRRRKHYLPEWAEFRGISRAAIIEATGADKSLVSRWLGETRSEPNTDYLQALAELFGVPSDRLYAPPGGEAALSAPIDVSGPAPTYAGVVAAGQFRPVDEYFNQDEPDMPPGIVRHPGYPKVRQYAWRAEGTSMDQAGILPGMWIVGADAGDYMDAYGDIESGDLVVVQRTRFQGAERELTVKEIRYYRDRYELHPRSSDASFKPIVVRNDQTHHDDEEVMVIGLVLSAFANLKVGRR